jgi:hypothetical protein
MHSDGRLGVIVSVALAVPGFVWPAVSVEVEGGDFEIWRTRDLVARFVSRSRDAFEVQR